MKNRICSHLLALELLVATVIIGISACEKSADTPAPSVTAGAETPYKIQGGWRLTDTLGGFQPKRPNINQNTVYIFRSNGALDFYQNGIKTGTQKYNVQKADMFYAHPTDPNYFSLKINNTDRGILFLYDNQMDFGFAFVDGISLHFVRISDQELQKLTGVGKL